MICESCGNENAMGNAFCTKCGSPLNNNQNMNQQMNNGIQMNMDNNK